MRVNLAMGLHRSSATRNPARQSESPWGLSSAMPPQTPSSGQMHPPPTRKSIFKIMISQFKLSNKFRDKFESLISYRLK
jgi:hypothetical protein